MLHTDAMRVLAAPDKMRGTASAALVAQAVAGAAESAGWVCEQRPVSDGGEGLLDCFGGANRHSEVTGPDGSPVTAGWRLGGAVRPVAVIEMARASGLAVAGAGHDPVAATTRGTGELVAAALDAGAREVIVGAGGSATTDGGLGAVDVLRQYAPLDGSRGYRVLVAADVTTGFVEAAGVFAPQKGADPGQVAVLEHRLRELAAAYHREYRVEVSTLPGAGAAGGLAGGLAALGARIEHGFELVAGQLRLPERILAADLVITAEGCVDATSSAGKAVGSLITLCARLGTPCRVTAGRIAADAAPELVGISIDLSARFGRRAAFANPFGCVRAASAVLLARRSAMPT